MSRAPACDRACRAPTVVRAVDWLSYAVHELPAGVLDGPNGATPDACREMLEDLEGFERLCTRLDLKDHAKFLEGCRWHFEHYPHYLARRRHFASYEAYTVDRKAPMSVPGPPPPPGWVQRPR